MRIIQVYLDGCATLADIGPDIERTVVIQARLDGCFVLAKIDRET
jgi:hypothetical protein